MTIESLADVYAAYVLECVRVGIRPLPLDALRDLLAALDDSSESRDG